MPRADIAILTVIPEEYEAVLARLSSSGCKTEHDPGSSTSPNQFGWVTGELRGARDHIYCIVVGIVVQPGPGRMASAVSATCARYKPQYVLIVGIAGGFPHDGLTKGDVALSRVIYDYDYGKVATDFQPRLDFTYQADQTLLTSAVSLHARDKSWAERDTIVIGTAYERTSVILTTNLPFENWTEVLGSERLTGAALDRITHRRQIIETTGESYRLQDAKRRRRPALSSGT